jgi:hypothetical protein
MTSVEGVRDALLVLRHLITVAEGKPISGVCFSERRPYLVRSRRIYCVLCDACSSLLYHAKRAPSWIAAQRTPEYKERVS